MVRVAEVAVHRRVEVDPVAAPAAAHNDRSVPLLVQPVAPERWRGRLCPVIGQRLSMPD